MEKTCGLLKLRCVFMRIAIVIPNDSWDNKHAQVSKCEESVLRQWMDIMWQKSGRIAGRLSALLTGRSKSTFTAKFSSVIFVENDVIPIKNDNLFYKCCLPTTIRG